MYQFQVSINDGGFGRFLDELADTRRLARRAMPVLYRLLLEWLDSAFEAEGIPSWAPLAEVTIFRRVAAGYGAGPILQRAGELRASLTQSSHQAHIHKVTYGVERSTLVVGTSLPKAAPLAFGDVESNLPARPIFPEDAVLHPELTQSIIQVARGL